MKAGKWFALAVVAAVAFSALALTGCSGAAKDSGSAANGGDSTSALAGSLSVEGSDTMVNLAQAWSETFSQANSDVMVSVKGGGSGTGIAALINGTVDFANASREMKDEEKAQAEENGVTPVEIEVAKDGIAVIVNPANPVEGLTTDQLGKIYRGEITNWKDVGGPDKRIVLLSRDTSSGTYEYFKEAVVGKEKEYAKAARLLGSSQQIVAETKGNDAAIGYVGIGYAESDGIKILKVDGTAASVASVLDRSYVLSRGLYMYSNGEPTTEPAVSYLKWILGADGQKIVEEQGFVPLGK